MRIKEDLFGKDSVELSDSFLDRADIYKNKNMFEKSLEYNKKCL